MTVRAQLRIGQLLLRLPPLALLGCNHAQPSTSISAPSQSLASGDFSAPSASVRSTSSPNPGATAAKPPAPSGSSPPAAEPGDPCAGPASPPRSYRVVADVLEGAPPHAFDQTERVVERRALGAYCAERLAITSDGRGENHALLLTRPGGSWTLWHFRQPLAEISQAAAEREVARLRTSDVMFTLGQKWQLLTVRPYHGIQSDNAVRTNAEIVSVARMGDTDYSFRRFSDGTGEIWVRRGGKLWFTWSSDAPDLSFAGVERLPSWATALGAPQFDVDKARFRGACAATVCVPAAVATPSKASEVAFLPGVGPLRIVERDYEAETGDGGTRHQLLEAFAPAQSTASALQGAPAADRDVAQPQAESKELESERKRLLAALDAEGLPGIVRAASPKFTVSAFDEAARAEDVIREDWTEPHRNCALKTLRLLLSRPCVELGQASASCSEPSLDPKTWSLASALCSEATVTLQKEGSSWRLTTYLDRLSHVMDAAAPDSVLPACAVQ